MGTKLNAIRRHAVSWTAMLPMAAIVIVAYLGTALWTLRISLSS